MRERLNRSVAAMMVSPPLPLWETRENEITPNNAIKTMLWLLPQSRVSRWCPVGIGHLAPAQIIRPTSPNFLINLASRKSPVAGSFFEPANASG